MIQNLLDALRLVERYYKAIILVVLRRALIIVSPDNKITLVFFLPSDILISCNMYLTTHMFNLWC